jgi:hypothetical protein
MDSIASVFTKATAQPPKPPPVMRHPKTPPLTPMSSAISTTASSSRQLTS